MRSMGKSRRAADDIDELSADYSDSTDFQQKETKAGAGPSDGINRIIRI